jgi:hypothetical protein
VFSAVETLLPDCPVGGAISFPRIDNEVEHSLEKICSLEPGDPVTLLLEVTNADLPSSK